MNKKVYFAGSIRGGRVDEKLYQRMIHYIQRTDIVLTEHVGDLSLSTLETELDNEERIYLQDTTWLRSADVVIAECSCPSLGVGYELAYREARGIPCYIFYDCSKTGLSAMLKGDGYFNVYGYNQESEIYPLIDEILR